MIANENDKNELGTQSRIFAKKLNDLHGAIHANKKGMLYLSTINICQTVIYYFVLC